jgi:hypothetical protein
LGLFCWLKKKSSLVWHNQAIYVKQLNRMTKQRH